SCTTSLAAGTHAIVASYAGDADNLGSDSGVLPQLVQPAPAATFADVPVTHWAFGSVEAVAWNGISTGCAANPRRFCPDAVLTRAEMATFLERAMRGPAFAYGPAGTLFADVPLTHWAAGPIEQLHADGVTAGCGAAPLRFCPDRPITRAEIAILLLKAKYGAGYAPGTATGNVFADVPKASWAAAWIERFSQLGFTSGCSAGVYCPDAHVGRAEMAVFLMRVFALAGPPT
ncbi:MAG TPA: S-layer homology domain-containing protein, partial [Casimicrobiaceae bacterium]|nr:S-layer homology domain-containing protein [Casimicrobiaceae bacterium]